VEFIGRVDQQVKVRGYRIELGEVEAALLEHVEVKEAAVVVGVGGSGEKRLVGYVVRKEEARERGRRGAAGGGKGVAEVEAAGAASGGESSSRGWVEEIRTYLRGKLPEYMVPGVVVELERLPLTGNGKVDRSKLPGVEEAGSGREQKEKQGPRTKVEEVLCGVWEEVLGVEGVGIEENFFELGGDSILSLRVKAQAESRGVVFALQALFEHQTIAALAAVAEVRTREWAEEEEGAAEKRAEKGETGAGGTEAFALVGEETRRELEQAREVEDAYPLGQLQAGMLFHSEYEPEKAVYHDVISYRLGLPWDEEALERALEQVVERHEVLRTSIAMGSYSEPVQIVHRGVKMALGVEDLRGQGEVEQKKRLEEWLEEEKRRGFRWEEAPLVRTYVHRLGEEEFQFSLSFHHAVMDGWSEASLITELFRRYQMLLTGETLELERLHASYRDYIALERAAMQSISTRKFWQELLSDFSPTPVPFAGRTEAQQNVTVRRKAIELQESEWTMLRKLAHETGVPFKTVLLAAHLKCLSVLTGSRDVTTGVVSNGRPEIKDGEQVLGLFLNTLPLRLKIKTGTWIELNANPYRFDMDWRLWRYAKDKGVKCVINDGASHPVDSSEIAFRTATIISEGTRMTAEVYSPKSAASDSQKLPTIVMAHGWGGVAAHLRPDAANFARAGYLVVTFDYRGWGASDSRVVLTSPQPKRTSDLRFTAEVQEVRHDPRVAIEGVELRRELGREGGDAVRLLGRCRVLDDLREADDRPRQGRLGRTRQVTRDGARRRQAGVGRLAQDRRDPGVGVLDVIDRVLVRLLLGQLDVEVDPRAWAT
jgi:hypothetical protein